MISVRLQGRLGNQLFQYAFIFAAAKKLNTDFYIDQYIEHSSLDKYFKNIRDIAITKLFSINGFKNIFNYHLRTYYYKKIARCKKLSLFNYDYKTIKKNIVLQDNALYQGYFQSDLFFTPYGDLIKEQFLLKEKFIEKFLAKYNNLYNDNYVVTVHIRRTDYQRQGHLNLGGDDLSLPLDYYKKAIATYEGKNVHFVFISDDQDFVDQNFKDITNKTISSDSEIMDFQHLLNADGCIVSNSTFSWWGAWLNNKPEKVIYVPKYFMGWRIKKEVPENIYPVGWQQIEFSN